MTGLNFCTVYPRDVGINQLPTGEKEAFGHRIRFAQDSIFGTNNQQTFSSLSLSAFIRQGAISAIYPEPPPCKDIHFYDKCGTLTKMKAFPIEKVA
jgi:hypothetical protein